MKEIKKVKGKTIKFRIISNSFDHQTLLDIVSETTVELCSHTGNKLPNLTELRQKLEPVYVIISSILNTHLKNKTREIEPNFLSGLTVNMMVSSGYYTIYVNYNDGEIATSYTMLMLPKDGKTIAMRECSHPVKLIIDGEPVINYTI